MAEDSSEPNANTDVEKTAEGLAPAAEPAPQPADTAQPVPTARRSGLPVALGLVLGGVIAAVLGFAAARTVVPEGWPFPGVKPQPDPLVAVQNEQAAQIDEMRGQIGALATRLEALEGAVQALQNDPRMTALQTALERTDRQLSDLSDALTALDARLLEVEKLPQGAGSEAADAAAAAYERELSGLREMLTQELAQIKAQQQAAQKTGQDAEAQARAASVQAAMAELRGALETGEPFADALAVLATAADENLPAPLPALAPTGVVTLAELRESFPEAARAALAASIAALVEEGKISRLEGFMRTQLGTRSLEPRQGDDPDAVLSRAEAALKNGDLETALAELNALPEAGRARMADWVGQAETRRAALAAADALAARLNLQ